MKKYKDILKEAEDLDELIGYLKGKYNTVKEVKECPRFKALSSSDKEYVLDELKSDLRESNYPFEIDALNKGDKVLILRGLYKGQVGVVKNWHYEDNQIDVKVNNQMRYYSIEDLKWAE